MLYLTPSRYRIMGTGVDLSGTTDAELRSTLSAASAQVNAAVHAPLGYTFLGGTVSAEPHTWNTGNVYQAASGRIWPFMRPLLDVSLLRINVTRTQYVDFDENQVFVQTQLGYLEPVAAPQTTALFTSVPPWLLSTPVAYVDYTYGFHSEATDELLTTYSGTLIADNQFWFTDEEVILKKDGVEVPEGDYTVDYTEGVITPDTPPAGEEWTASYHHKLPLGISNATALIATDVAGFTKIVSSGMLGLSGIKVEEVELRQSSKINFAVQPTNAAALLHLAPYAAMFVSMR